MYTYTTSYVVTAQCSVKQRWRCYLSANHYNGYDRISLLCKQQTGSSDTKLPCSGHGYDNTLSWCWTDTAELLGTIKHCAAVSFGNTQSLREGVFSVVFPFVWSRTTAGELSAPSVIESRQEGARYSSSGGVRGAVNVNAPDVLIDCLQPTAMLLTEAQSSAPSCSINRIWILPSVCVSHDSHSKQRHCWYLRQEGEHLNATQDAAASSRDAELRAQVWECWRPDATINTTILGHWLKG
jgi:hypothetical protein